ncbi:MAG: transcription antitermination factor NusB [Phycisphaerales bacterium JB064]
MAYSRTNNKRPKSRFPAATTARSVVHQRLREEAHRYPDLGLEPLDTSALKGPGAGREAALAHAIYDAVMRRWITLEAMLAPHLTGPNSRPVHELDSTVRAALLAGAAQLLLLERVPPHAAINEAVNWTRSAGKPKATGLVNAVLRRVSESVARAEEGWPVVIEEPVEAHVGKADRLPLSDGRALQLTRDVFPTETLPWLEAATGNPRSLVEQWHSRLGEAGAIEQALHTLVSPPVVINHAHADAVVEAPEGQTLTPHETNDGLSVLGPVGSSPREILKGRKDIWVQDATSAGALDLLENIDPKPKLIVDLCAGLGTKTRQLRAMFPEATIYACDTNEARAKGLRRVFAKDELTEVMDIDDVRYEAAGKADLVLLDVPCSNSGVLPRRPEARYRLTTDIGREQLDRLTTVQHDLLAQSQAMLAPGGRVLYATCSMDEEENQAITKWAVESVGFTLERERFVLPKGLPGQPPTAYADGGYAALLAIKAGEGR